ncbi:hypothetical protein JCM8097_007518 [Rhodosporidiobolus ruineniae]
MAHNSSPEPVSSQEAMRATRRAALHSFRLGDTVYQRTSSVGEAITPIEPAKSKAKPVEDDGPLISRRAAGLLRFRAEKATKAAEKEKAMGKGKRKDEVREPSPELCDGSGDVVIEDSEEERVAQAAEGSGEEKGDDLVTLPSSSAAAPTTASAEPLRPASVDLESDEHAAELAHSPAAAPEDAAPVLPDTSPSTPQPAVPRSPSPRPTSSPAPRAQPSPDPTPIASGSGSRESPIVTLAQTEAIDLTQVEEPAAPTRMADLIRTDDEFKVAFAQAMLAAMHVSRAHTSNIRGSWDLSRKRS